MLLLLSILVVTAIG